MLEVRRRLQKYAPMRRRRAQCAVVQFRRRRPLRYRFLTCVAQTWSALASYADDLMKRSQSLGGIVDADTTLKLNKPELRVENRSRARPPTSAWTATDIATALRLMVGGEDRASRFRDESINEDYDVQLRLNEKDRSDVAHDSSGFTFLRRAGGLVRLDNLIKINRDTSPLAHRSTKP